MTKGLAMVNLKVRFVENIMFKVDAIILTNLTSFAPKFTNISHDRSVFLSLPLADPGFASNQSIDKIFGADLYPIIL